MKRPIGNRLLALLLALVMLFALTPAAFAEDGADGGGAGTTPGTEQGGEAMETPDDEEPTEDVMPDAITISLPNALDPMKVGEERTLNLTVTPELTAEQMEKVTVEWGTTNNYDRISYTVDPDNPRKLTVKAEKTVETTITDPVTITCVVRWDGKSSNTATCDATVVPNDPASVAVKPKDLELGPGQTGQLSASVSPETADQTVTWRTANASVATVSDTGLVTGVAAGETTVTATSVAGGKEASCAVTVQGIVLNDKSVTVKEGSNVTLGYTIYGASIKNNAVEWNSSEPSVARVDNGYVYGLAQGTTTITAKVNGTSYSTTCEVKVERNTADIITASVDAGAPLSFSSIQSRLQTQSSNVLGRSLSYISGLSVSTSQGTLYYRYQSDSDTGAGIGTGERYYISPSLGQMAISDISFVPKSDFSGTAVINYTGYADGTTFFQGTIEVTVAELEEITYTTTGQKAVQFSVDDFNRMCRSRTGRDINYVVFTQPDSSKGTLYYGYISAQNYGSKVDEAKQYRRNGSPGLADVYFVPSGSYTGEVIISYTAYDVNGDSFRGRVKVRVSQGSATGDLNYDISQGGKLTLDDDDFNDLSKTVTGYALDYVRFTLPSSSEGTLYYNYTSSGDYDSKVTASRSYYRSSSPYLDRVTFVPKSGFTGTVSIDFVGYSTDDEKFEGTVEIGVDAGSDQIAYTVRYGGTVTLDDGDFDSLSEYMTGDDLRYVRFELPDSSKGTLYYNYDDGDYDSKVAASRSYYFSSSPYLEKVTFVPDDGFAGTVSIDFTGWSTGGEKFEGTMKITVEPPAGPTLITYTTTYSPVTFQAQDFVSACLNRGLGGLVSVRFTLPSSSYGRLYYQYSGINSTQVREGSSYYPDKSPSLSEVSFLPRTGYQGTVTITYTATDSRDNTYQGQIQINVQPSTYSRYFSDMGYYTWAVSAVDFLYENGVVTGTGNGTYSPGQAITRGDFMLMLCRTFGFQNAAGAGFPDVPADSYYAQAIRTAQALGIAAGYPDGGFYPDAPLYRQDAMVFLQRALQAAGWSLGSANTTLLNSFRDGGEVTPYAQEAVALMVSYGILSGTSDGRIAPHDYLTRAEMAVILARVINL